MSQKAVPILGTRYSAARLKKDRTKKLVFKGWGWEGEWPFFEGSFRAAPCKNAAC